MEEETKKIYIGNLEFGLTEGDVRKFLESEGVNPKELRIITDKFTGRSKGFGFAEFDTEEQTQSAITTLNGKQLNGRTLQVNLARKMRPRTDNRGSRSYGRGASRF